MSRTYLWEMGPWLLAGLLFGGVGIWAISLDALDATLKNFVVFVLFLVAFGVPIYGAASAYWQEQAADDDEDDYDDDYIETQRQRAAANERMAGMGLKPMWRVDPRAAKAKPQGRRKRG